MNIANAHNVPEKPDKPTTRHRPPKIIAEPVSLVAEGL